MHTFDCSTFTFVNMLSPRCILKRKSVAMDSIAVNPGHICGISISSSFVKLGLNGIVTVPEAPFIYHGVGMELYSNLLLGNCEWEATNPITSTLDDCQKQMKSYSYGWWKDSNCFLYKESVLKDTIKPSPSICFINTVTNNCALNSSIINCKSNLQHITLESIVYKGFIFTQQDSDQVFYTSGLKINTPPVDETVITLESCKSKCLNDPQCIAFSWNWECILTKDPIDSVPISPAGRSTLALILDRTGCIRNETGNLMCNQSNVFYGVPGKSESYLYNGVRFSNVFPYKDLLVSQCRFTSNSTDYAGIGQTGFISAFYTSLQDCFYICMNDPECTHFNWVSRIPSAYCQIFHNPVDHDAVQVSDTFACGIKVGKTGCLAIGGLVDCTNTPSVTMVNGLIFNLFDNVYTAKGCTVNTNQIPLVTTAANSTVCADICSTTNCTLSIYNEGFEKCSVYQNITKYDIFASALGNDCIIKKDNSINGTVIECDGKKIESAPLIPKQDVYFKDMLFTFDQTTLVNYRCAFETLNSAVFSINIGLAAQCALSCNSLITCTYFVHTPPNSNFTDGLCELFDQPLDITYLKKDVSTACGFRLAKSRCTIGNNTVLCEPGLPNQSPAVATVTFEIFFTSAITLPPQSTLDITNPNSQLEKSVQATGIISLDPGIAGVGSFTESLAIPQSESTNDGIQKNPESPTETVLVNHDSKPYLYDVLVGGTIGSAILNITILAAFAIFYVKTNRIRVISSQEAKTGQSSSPSTKDSDNSKTTKRNLSEFRVQEAETSITPSKLFSRMEQMNQTKIISPIKSNLWTSPADRIYIFANGEGLEQFEDFIKFFYFPKNLLFKATANLEYDGCVAVHRGDEIKVKIHQYNGFFLGTNESTKQSGKFNIHSLPIQRNSPKLILVHCPEIDPETPFESEFIKENKKYLAERVQFKTVAQYQLLSPSEFIFSGIFEGFNLVDKMLICGSQEMMVFIFEYLEGVANETWSFIDAVMISPDYQISADNYPCHEL
ncbi:hypothetical protein HDV06_001756 [Boothiomyces sp. JEL0866]|nr:hypothetical protein HDV06_001756 [Boothiomyces sp. JEL0866]